MSKIRPYSYLLAFETTKGVTPTGADLKPFALCLKSDEMVYSKEYGDEDKCFGDIDAGGQKEQVNFKLDGNITASQYYEQLPIYLKLLLGEMTNTDNGDGSFKHEFKSSTENNVTATAQTIVGKNDELFSIINGLTASKFSFNIEKGKDAETSLSCMGMKYDDNKINPALTKLDEANKVELGKTKVNYNSVDIKLNGVSDCSLSQLSIDIDRNLKEYDTLCKDEKKDIEQEGLSVSGKLSSLWNADLYNIVTKDDLVKLEVEIKLNDKNKINITIDEVQFMFKSQPKKVGEVYNIEVDFNGVKVATTDKIKIAVTNEVSSY